MDTQKKRILFSASIVTTVAALTLAFAWQGGSTDTVVTSTNQVVRGQRHDGVVDTPRTKRPKVDRKINKPRKIRDGGRHNPKGSRNPRRHDKGLTRVIKDEAVPMM